VNALGLVNEAIEALTAADAGRLCALAERAQYLRVPEAGEERRELMARRRVLAGLLRHTRQNLRLLGSRTPAGGGLRNTYPLFRNEPCN
jgi:hypothetical protein